MAGLGVAVGGRGVAEGGRGVDVAGRGAGVGGRGVGVAGRVSARLCAVAGCAVNVANSFGPGVKAETVSSGATTVPCKAFGLPPQAASRITPATTIEIVMAFRLAGIVFSHADVLIQQTETALVLLPQLYVF